MNLAVAGEVAKTYGCFWQRRRFWLWSLGLFVVAVVGFVALLPSTRALVQFHRIGAGMTEEDVVALLGRPNNRLHYPVPSLINGDSGLAWYVGELNFFVAFFDGKVIQKRMHTDVPLVRRWFRDYFGRNLL